MSRRVSYSSATPSRTSFAVNWQRLTQSSRIFKASMWLSTVRRDSARFRAISRAVLPPTTCRAISSCRVVIAKVMPRSALVESVLSVLSEGVVHIDDVRGLLVDCFEYRCDSLAHQSM